MSRPLRAAGYIRVSDPKSAKKGITLKDQAKEITNFAKWKNWKLTIYADKGISGYITAKRLRLQQLLIDAERGMFDVVVVYAIDRFGRNTREFLANVDLLENMGVKFHSIRENVDFSTTAGRLIRNVFAAVAEWERETIAERALVGKLGKAKHGIPTEGKMPIARSLNKETGEWVLHEEKADKIRIGEGLAALALLHHRAYGSVHGGSYSLS